MGLAMKLREIQPKAGKSKLQKADKYTTKEPNTKNTAINETNKEAFDAHDKRTINFTTIHS